MAGCLLPSHKAEKCPKIAVFCYFPKSLIFLMQFLALKLLGALISLAHLSIPLRNKWKTQQKNTESPTLKKLSKTKLSSCRCTVACICVVLTF